MSIIDYEAFVHTGPETLAGRYLRMFWQPVQRAQDLLPGRAKPITVMGEQFTLYRGESGSPHVVAHRCAHRGTQLSTGWVEGDCIRCFYHGWKYEASGQCIEQPAEQDRFASKVRIASYPTEEYLGLIFAYFGEGTPPPLPRYPEFEEDGLLEVTTYTRPCNYFNNLENGPDEVHVAFAHRNSRFTDYGLLDIPSITAEETEYGILQEGTRANGTVRTNYLLMPNILYVKVAPRDPEEKQWRDYISWRVPVDDESHLSFIVNLVHLSGEAASRYQSQRNEQIVDHGPSIAALAEAVLAGRLQIDDIEDRSNIVWIQDYIAMVGQGVIPDRKAERLGRSDVAIILLRRIWARELRALAEGHPCKQWRRSGRLAAVSGVATAEA